MNTIKLYNYNKGNFFKFLIITIIKRIKHYLLAFNTLRNTTTTTKKPKLILKYFERIFYFTHNQCLYI